MEGYSEIPRLAWPIAVVGWLVIWLMALIGWQGSPNRREGKLYTNNKRTEKWARYHNDQ